MTAVRITPDYRQQYADHRGDSRDELFDDYSRRAPCWASTALSEIDAGPPMRPSALDMM